ncbi:hypothetical protein VIBRN418_15528 [Vibrio sp. N418]|nr:hypothetical protein VIBRN418_15528 [Vibrio sp. N418]
MFESILIYIFNEFGFDGFLFLPLVILLCLFFLILIFFKIKLI